MKKKQSMARFGLILATLLTLETAVYAADATAKVTLNEAEFRDKVYACWLGKNIGGTLGMPFEGKTQAQELSFYTNIKKGEPAANDDLDLQILWLKAMQEHDAQVDTRILGEYWLKFVPVDWNEYGVGKKNMRKGLLPPLSGEFDNAKWKHSNGAWIRSEIWACLYPGSPGLAAKMGREDACVDHGAAEGTLAEIFTTAVESAAFIESDRDKLIDIGLAMIPPESQVAKAIRTAIDAKKAGKDWKEARLEVIKASEATGWFQAPRNVAFTMIGWLYGDGDFGKSICIAVNCGDDTDCTGATLGSIFGIIHGTKGIPPKWSKPIGIGIKTVAIKGFEHANDLNALTDQTVAMTKKVQAKYDLPVVLSDQPTDLRGAGGLVLADTATAKTLWALSPYKIVWNEKDMQAVLDYMSDPWFAATVPRQVELTILNRAGKPAEYTVALNGVPAGWKVEGMVTTPIKLDNGKSITMPIILVPTETDSDCRMKIDIAGGAVPISIPFTLISKEGIQTVSADDLALASKGATATADGEYAKEAPCAAKVIDGIIPAPEAFDNKRWHSALAAPHPHWIEIKLPKTETIGRVVVHFADPKGYPVKFAGFIKPEGGGELVQVFSVDGNKNSRIHKATIDPVKTDTFRLMIYSSANPQYPNAAQIGEIQLRPPAAK